MSQETSGCAQAVILVIWGILVSMVAYRTGVENGESAQRKAAVKAGVAQWIVDKETGDVRFEYAGKGG